MMTQDSDSLQRLLPSMLESLDQFDYDLGFDLDFDIEHAFNGSSMPLETANLQMASINHLSPRTDYNTLENDCHAETLADLSQTLEDLGMIRSRETGVEPLHENEESALIPRSIDSPQYDVLHDTATTHELDDSHSIPRGFIRTVNIVQNACRTAQQNILAHNALQESEMTQYNLRADMYASFVQQTGRAPSQTTQTFSTQALWRVQRFQEELIEPRVGCFSHNDNVHIQRFPRAEDRLLTVLHIGLLRQELFGAIHADVDAKRILDINGSCLLEARVWQLEILGLWRRELEEAIVHAGGSFTEE